MVCGSVTRWKVNRRGLQGKHKKNRMLIPSIRFDKNCLRLICRVYLKKLLPIHLHRLRKVSHWGIREWISVRNILLLL